MGVAGKGNGIMGVESPVAVFCAQGTGHRARGTRESRVKGIGHFQPPGRLQAAGARR